MAFAGAQADAESLGGFEDEVLVVGRAHVESRRRSAGEQLGNSQARGGRHLLRRKRRLVRPDALRKPTQEWQPLGTVPGEALHHVHVGLHETGQHEGVPRVEESGPVFLQSVSDGTDEAVLDEDVGLEERAGCGHRDDHAAADENRPGGFHKTPILVAGPFSVKSTSSETVASPSTALGTVPLSFVFPLTFSLSALDHGP